MVLLEKRGQVADQHLSRNMVRVPYERELQYKLQ